MLEVIKNAYTFRKCYSTFIKLFNGSFHKENFFDPWIIDMVQFLGTQFSLRRAGRSTSLFSFPTSHMG